MAAEFQAILLAGGRSTRMGRDKALLAWQGRPLIDHMLDRLREAGASRVHVSGDRPAYGGIADAWPGRGPVAGIASVLPACGDGPVVVVPVDLPLLGSGRVAELVH
ncbi:MAG: molybdenum cofactor guanylyltransferase, partial [Pseudomonadota bacterium]